MKLWNLTAQTAFATVFLAATVQAQVTPEQVWQNWQKLGATFGQALVADQVVRSGDTLVVSGMAMAIDQEDIRMNGTLEEVRFRDLGDGTVEVTMSDTSRIKLLPLENGASAETLDLVLTKPGLRLVAGGSATQTSYTLDAPTIGLTAQSRAGNTTIADVTATLTGLVGTYLLTSAGDVTSFSTALDAQTMAFSVKAQSPMNTVDASGTMAAVKIGTSGDFLGLDAMEDLASALKNGLNSTSDFSHGAGSFAFNGTENGKNTRISATNEAGRVNFAIDDQRLTYGLGSTGVTLTATGDDIPVPEAMISYGEATVDFMIPVAASDTPMEFSLVTRIVDLVLPDVVWGMVDPTATLPRDPATLIVETFGTATLANDLLDEAAIAAAGDAPMGELNSLEVATLTARAAGVELTGTGAFTFDNGDLVTFDGIPAPTGQMNLVLTGGNGLLDRLVAMGLIPQDQAMFARMMVAMVAKPGVGEDVLNSSIEFRDKSIYANGQRLK